MNIIKAIEHKKLFHPFLRDADGKIETWRTWMTALRCLYGLPLPAKEKEQDIALIEGCTGRDYESMPEDGFSTGLFLTGRRSGKSRTAAVIGAFEAVLARNEKKLAKGETGLVVVVSPTRSQSKIVKSYIKGVFDTPMLADEVVKENQNGFELRNGVRIEIAAGDFRTIRGFTLLAAIVDEVCFFGMDEESKIKSDTELIRAIKPALATTRGKLVCISSPYARRGWSYKTYERYFGNNSGTTLVWNAPSRIMNVTLPQSIVDEAMAEDMQAAKSEYLGEFRDDVGEFIPRQVIESLVIRGRLEQLPVSENRYFAFVDVSGGRGDDAALAIGHRRDRVVVVDFIKRWTPPFSPYMVIGEIAAELRRFGVRKVTGDNYSAEFVAQAFQNSGIRYEKAEKPKSQLYAELLPLMCSKQLELLDNPILVTQLPGLERRTRSGGRDIIDHAPGGHDDVANALAGLCVVAAVKRVKVGAFFKDDDLSSWTGNPYEYEPVSFR